MAMMLTYVYAVNWNSLEHQPWIATHEKTLRVHLRITFREVLNRPCELLNRPRGYILKCFTLNRPWGPWGYILHLSSLTASTPTPFRKNYINL